MKKLELYKYPRSILVPIVLFIIAMVLVFVVYKIHSVDITDTPNIESPVKMPINTKATFNVDTEVKIGTPEKEPINIHFSGKSIINIDLANGEILLENLNLKANSVKLTDYNIKNSLIEVNLNPSYPSTGKVDLNTGKMDISLDLKISCKPAKQNKNIKLEDLNMTIPLSGNIDRDYGIIKLDGKATIPPREESLPLPVSIQVIATTDPIVDTEVNNNKEN